MSEKMVRDDIVLPGAARTQSLRDVLEFEVLNDNVELTKTRFGWLTFCPALGDFVVSEGNDK